MGLSTRLAMVGVLGSLLARAHLARAQDGSVGDASTSDASGDAATDARPHIPPVCPTAITSADGDVVFHRMGAIDLLPGTGMQSVGDHSSLGLDYNLGFSGSYDTEMRGHLHLAWPRALRVTAIGTPMGGYLDVHYGLRMTATLWIAGTPIPIPLDVIIADNEGHGRSVFTPWAWNYEGTQVHINVSAWRTLWGTSFSVGGSGINVDLQMRYNVDVSIRTIEIGFPDRNSVNSSTANLSQITVDMPEALVPPPRDGNLDLLTRWKSQLRYDNRFEFRIYPSCSSPCWQDPICCAATGLLGSVLTPIQTPPFATVPQTLPDPYDNMPHFDLPVQQVDRAEIDFGDVNIREMAMDMFTVTNPGRSTLATDPLPPAAPEFSVAAGGCVEPGRSLAIPVIFRPSAVGQFSSEIRVNSNGTIGTPARVRLIGRGVTGPTVRPGADGGAGDGGVRSTEYRGARGAAGCGCRVAGSSAPAGGRNQSLAGLAFGLTALALRRRRRSVS